MVLINKILLIYERKIFHFNSNFWVILIHLAFEINIRKFLFDKVKMLFEK